MVGILGVYISDGVFGDGILQFIAQNVNFIQLCELFIHTSHYVTAIVIVAMIAIVVVVVIGRLSALPIALPFLVAAGNRFELEKRPAHLRFSTKL
jgi:hypothetical protein